MDTDAAHGAALRSEQRWLLVSTVAAAFFAVVAILWGFLAGSQIILLDGIYALIGFALGGLSLRAAVLVERGPTPHYPFGREALAPMMVGIQGLVLLGSLVYALLDAVRVIAAGGSETAFGAALGYGVASAVFGGLMAALLRARSPSSELLAAEAAQWFAGMLLSIGMVVGFGSALLLQGTDGERFVPYIDPAMVVLAALFIAPTPLAMLRQTYRELLEGVPPREVAEPIEAAVRQLSEEYGLPEAKLRTGKLGRKVYVEVDYLVGEHDAWTIADADVVRRTLHERLREPGRLLWINVELHTDPGYDED